MERTPDEGFHLHGVVSFLREPSVPATSAVPPASPSADVSTAAGSDADAFAVSPPVPTALASSAAAAAASGASAAAGSGESAGSAVLPYACAREPNSEPSAAESTALTTAACGSAVCVELSVESTTSPLPVTAGFFFRFLFSEFRRRRRRRLGKHQLAPGIACREVRLPLHLSRALLQDMPGRMRRTTGTTPRRRFRQS